MRVTPCPVSSPAALVSSRWWDSSSRRRTAQPKAAASGPRDGDGAAPPPRLARFRACCRACALDSMALLGMQATSASPPTRSCSMTATDRPAATAWSATQLPAPRAAPSTTTSKAVIR